MHLPTPHPYNNNIAMELPVPVAFAMDSRTFGASLAAQFYGDPSEDPNFNTFAVLGSVGKTTTCHILRTLLQGPQTCPEGTDYEWPLKFVGMMTDIEWALHSQKIHYDGDFWAPTERDPSRFADTSVPYRAMDWSMHFKYEAPATTPDHIAVCCALLLVQVPQLLENVNCQSNSVACLSLRVHCICASAQVRERALAVQAQKLLYIISERSGGKDKAAIFEASALALKNRYLQQVHFNAVVMVNSDMDALGDDKDDPEGATAAAACVLTCSSQLVILTITVLGRLLRLLRLAQAILQTVFIVFKRVKCTLCAGHSAQKLSC